jgi:hypothetical protein
MLGASLAGPLETYLWLVERQSGKVGFGKQYLLPSQPASCSGKEMEQLLDCCFPRDDQGSALKTTALHI